MYCFYVKGVCITASFRVPETHTFHQTLPLPSKTMMIGLMGAALGLSVEEAHTFSNENGIYVSVYGKSKGIMRDLWNYRKVTVKNYSEEQIKSRAHYSVLTREFLVYPKFMFVYASENKDAIVKIHNAFMQPVYALTAGNSDDLLKITEISDVSDVNSDKLSKFENTVLPGDLSSKCKYDVKSLLMNKPVTFSLRMPEVFSLPTGFTFNGDVRSGVNLSPFTFISHEVNLSEPIDGYVLDGKNFVVY